MIISTPRTKRSRTGPAHRRAPVAGFTLTEVMIASGLSVLVLTGVLSAFLMIGRSGYLASSYSELGAQTSRGLDTFGNDVRKSCDIHWNSAQSVTLTVVTSGNLTRLVTYAYDATTGNATSGTFYCLEGDTASTAPRQILIRNVASDFAFQRFKLEQPGVSDNTATSDLETKQLQLTFRAMRAGSTTVSANQSALSARYILRNKRVSN
jgi:hypothetical protein